MWEQRQKCKVFARTTIDSIFADSKSTAFVIIRNDSALFERYYMGRKRESVSTIYSISKMLTCLLAQITIDEGIISSIGDAVQYIFMNWCVSVT